MADPSPKPAARRAGPDPGARRSSRLRIAGKLTALLGLPSLVIFSIYAGGVYVGARQADRVVELEQRWLGIEPPPGRLVASGAGAAGAAEAEPGAEPKPAEPKPAEPKPAEPKPAEPKPAEPAEPKPSEPPPGEAQAEPQPPDPVAAQTNPASPGLAAASPDPVGPELRSRFDEAKAVRIQLLVDPALVVARPDWLTYVAELFAATQTSFDRLFGIELQLYGILVWDGAVGVDDAALLARLRERPRLGADMVVGLVARAAPSGYTPPTWTAELTGDHALVYADLQAGAGEDRFYRNLLRGLALAFGAEPTSDPAHKQLGSFMADSKAVGAPAPALDPENRGKVIINKRRPFARPELGPSEDPEEGSI